MLEITGSSGIKSWWLVKSRLICWSEGQRVIIIKEILIYSTVIWICTDSRNLWLGFVSLVISSNFIDIYNSLGAISSWSGYLSLRCLISGITYLETWIRWIVDRSNFIKILLILHYLIEFVDVGYVLLDEVVIALVESLSHQYVLIARVLGCLQVSLVL